MSFAAVLTALPARLVAVPYSELTAHWLVAVNLLARSLAGAWAGASWATRHALRSNGRFVIAMTAGSIAGTLAGALLLGIVPNLVLIPALPCSSWSLPSSFGVTSGGVVD